MCVANARSRATPACPKGQYQPVAPCAVLPPDEPVLSCVRWGLSMTIHRWIAAVPERPARQPDMPCCDLIEQAEALVLADLDAPLHISALCRALAVSERALRKAFHRSHGAPPCRQLRMLRLSHARSALLSADCKSATVTEIATCFGFVELGRFSVEYRKTFGESPSHTLHRTSPDSPPVVSGSTRLDSPHFVA